MHYDIARIWQCAFAGSLLALSGCDILEDAAAPRPIHEPDSYVTGTYPRFDPATPDLPLNTDLLFAAAASSDGTAHIGAAADPLRAAVNQLDGFSTSAFFDVLISGSVDPASVVASESVFLLELDSAGRDALDLANVVGVADVADHDVVVVSQSGGADNVIRIRPTVPLKAATKYLVFITDDVRDAAGDRLTRSWTYNSLRDTSYPTVGALAPVRQAIVQWETLASRFLVSSGRHPTATVARRKLVLTYTFTTTDPTAVLHAMAAPRAALASMQIAAGVAPATAVSNVLALDAMQALPTPRPRDLGVSVLTGIDFSAFSASLAASVGRLYTGYIRLPYYQTAATGLPFAEHLNRSWQPDLTLAGALGSSIPTDVDGSFNVTYRAPFARRNSDESVPLQVGMPRDNWVPGYAGSANCGQIYAATGYPTVLFVHGIGSDRTSALRLAHSLAARCIATVAIDLPLHGIAANSAFVNVLNVERSRAIPFDELYGDNAPRERHFNVAGSVSLPVPMDFDAPGSADSSGNHFINFRNLGNARDNSRQAVMDLLNLNASLGRLGAELSGHLDVSLDVNRVHVVGVTWGGSLATVFAAVNQQAIAADARVGLASSLNPVRGVVASGAGSQIAQMLANSPSLSPVLDAALGANGVHSGTTDHARFLYAAQSAWDTVDPVSYLQRLAAFDLPVLLQQMEGDTLFPNSTQVAPLAGTQAMADLLGASQLGLGPVQLGRGHVRLAAGGGNSLVRPEGGAPQVTTELDRQVVTFVLNNGSVVVGEAAPGDVVLPGQ